MKIESEFKCFGGRQLRFSHESKACNCRMKFSLYLPPQAEHADVPLLIWLSGLSCSDQNFMLKAGAQYHAAHHGVALLAPDTSPRGAHIPGDPDQAWDFGLGAGFYLDAVEEPWKQYYQMNSYVGDELPQLLAKSDLRIDWNRQSIFGHSMGGHGALIQALNNPSKYCSVSAFAPICSPMNCPWGIKAFNHYLGDNKTLWQQYDSCALIKKRAYDKPLLIDQGTADSFLQAQLKPELLQKACKDRGVELHLRLQAGYDHSYFFIATFIEDHINFHAKLLATTPI